MSDKNKIKVSARSIELKKLYDEPRCMGTFGIIDLLLQEFDTEIYELKQANEKLEAEKAALSQRVGRSASADYEELKRYWNNYLDALKNGCEGKSLLHNVRVLLGRV